MKKRKRKVAMSELIEKKETALELALAHVIQNPKDIDIEKLEKMLDLQERILNKKAESEYNVAMAAFQRECPVIVKKKKVDFTSKTGNRTKYDYAPFDEIVAQVKPLLAKHGLTYSFRTEYDNSSMSMICIISHDGGHKQEYCAKFPKLHDDQRMNEFQRTKSAITYAKRAVFENALGIAVADEDDDARRSSEVGVTDLQIETIRNLLLKTDSNLDQFLKFLRCESLESMSELDYKRAVVALNQKAKAIA